MLAFRNRLEAVAGGGIPYALDATAASIRDAINDPASYASGGWRLPGLAGARLSASARASVAMQQRVDGGWEFAPHNLLTNSATMPWTYSNMTAAPGVADPWGGNTAITLTATANGGFVLFDTGAKPGQTATNSVWVRRRTGFGGVDLRTPSNGPEYESVTTSWQRLQVSGLSGASNCYWILVLEASGDQVDVVAPQQNLGSIATAYIPTTTTAVYGPAIDWLSGIGAYGLRSEESRTNLALWSADMSNAAWLVTGAGAAKVGAATALGAIPMYRINVGTVGGAIASASAFYQGAMTLAAAQPHTLQVIVRSVSGTSPFRLSIYDNGSVTGSADLTATTTPTVYSVTRTTETGTSAGIAIRAATAGGVVGDIEVGAVQLEQGAFATSPILTFGASATRAKDIPVIPMTLGVDGTVVADYVVATTPPLNAVIVGTDGVNDLALMACSGTTRGVTLWDGSGGIATANQASAEALARAASAWGSAGTGSVVVNGGTVATGSVVVANIDAATMLTLGNDDGSALALNHHIARVRYATRRFTNAELQAVTA